MYEKLLSFCIPTYNRVHCLRELLPNVIAQCEREPGCECLVVDNCSTDATGGYVQEMAKGHPAMRYVCNESNIGADRNFLRCIECAAGEYVWIFGDDDLLDKDGVHRIVSLIKEHPDVALIQCGGVEADALYPDYRALLKAYWKANKEYALHRSLISCNIFRKRDFDLGYAYAKLKTSYAHMFGLRAIFTSGKRPAWGGGADSRTPGGQVMAVHGVVGVRSEREPFAAPVRFIRWKWGLFYLFLFRQTGLFRLLPLSMHNLFDRRNVKELRKYVKRRLRDRTAPPVRQVDA